MKDSELILNPDGSVFHLHLLPEHLADMVILVGDPGRVDMISTFFSRIEYTRENREFKSVTGYFNEKRLSVVSTGIGTDNIDIVLNELDALANIDLQTKELKEKHKTLKIVRIGTSGSLQKDIPVNAAVVSEKSIGFDGLLNFYADRDHYTDLDFEAAFTEFTRWAPSLPSPYVVDASGELLDLFDTLPFQRGINISAPGFYGPQGRVLRLKLAHPELNNQIEAFRYKGKRLTNYEMESSAIYGLSKMLGHEALTICLIIANRITREANEKYTSKMNILVGEILNRLTK